MPPFPYYCDILIPTRSVVIEVYGGIHTITHTRDALRRAFLEAQGLTVIVLHDTDSHPLTPVEIQHALDRIEHPAPLQIDSPA